MEVAASDAELVRQIDGRIDRAAEAELYRRMAPRVRLYGLRHLRDENAADDLAQQVLLTTIEALREGRLREPAKLVSFVLGTCRMTVLNLRRGVRRKESLLKRFADDVPYASHPAVPSLDGELLAQCVQNLKERERSVVVLSFYDERSGADVARFMGVSQANVRIIRHRAIRKLRKCMGAD